MGGTPVPATPSPQSPPEGATGQDQPPIRVLIAEDVTVVRETLTALLSLEPDLQVAAAVDTGDQIMPAA